MRQDESLWQNVLDRPLSSMARRVYADWLEEQGDPRGEFIQVQCAADALPMDHPRKHFLETRAAELLRLHESEWLGPMRGRVRSWQFRRGLLEWVSVDTSSFLAHADEWVNSTGLLGVHLRKARNHLEALAECPALRRLTALYLGDNDLNHEDLRKLLRSPHLEQLRRLYLQSNDLDADAVRALGECRTLRNLRDLNLGRNLIRTRGVEMLVKSPYLKRLRRLNLICAGLEMPAAEQLANWSGLGRLSQLFLTGNFYTPGALSVLVRSPHFYGVSLLAVDMNDVSDNDLHVLAESENVRSLRCLVLARNRQLGDNGLPALARSPHLSKLKELYLGYSTFGNGSLTALGRSETLRSLRVLNLSGGCNGDASGLEAFLSGPLLPRLRALDLNCMHANDACLRALARHGRLRLRYWHVDLRHAQSAAWEELLTSGALRSLTHLVLKGLPVGGLSALSQASGVDGTSPVPLLTALRVHSWSGGINEIRQLANSELLARLRILCLAGNSEDNRTNSIVELSSSPRVANLTELELSGSSMGDLAVQTLVAGKHWHRLMDLNLGGCRLSSRGVEALAGWPGLAQLRQLNLRSCRMDNKGVEALARSSYSSDLLCIDLDHSELSSELKQTLRQSFGPRVAFAWRSVPDDIVFGGYPHDDT